MRRSQRVRHAHGLHRSHDLRGCHGMRRFLSATTILWPSPTPGPRQSHPRHHLHLPPPPLSSPLPIPRPSAPSTPHPFPTHSPQPCTRHATPWRALEACLLPRPPTARTPPDHGCARGVGRHGEETRRGQDEGAPGRVAGADRPKPAGVGAQTSGARGGGRGWSAPRLAVAAYCWPFARPACYWPPTTATDCTPTTTTNPPTTTAAATATTTTTTATTSYYDYSWHYCYYGHHNDCYDCCGYCDYYD